MHLMTRIFVLPAFAAILFLAQGAWADAVKDRMMARLPVINELKSKGIVGENNQGYLEFRTGDRSQAAVVDAENQDRRAVYQAIAARQNTTTEFVGQTRAAQIADRESPGVWIQNSAGAWNKK
jgi:uncharacterized protein YdbL (DUF1318 family)